MQNENIKLKNPISRRAFLEYSAKLGSALTAGMLFPGLPSENTPLSPSSPVVAVVKGVPPNAVSKAIELVGGIGSFVQPGSTVLIKPNVSFPNSKTWGTTTSPEVVKAVTQLILDAGAKRVIIADNTMRKTDICFHKTGIMEMLSDMDKVNIIPIQQENFFREVPVPGGKALTRVKIARLIQRADLIINLPCAKSHSATQVSFGLKNLMGLIWDRSYLHQGTDLHTAIAELALVMQPQLTILDATRALITAGPTGPGKVQNLNTIIASTDILAVDAYAVSLAPWNNRFMTANTVKHLYQAAQLGIGEINLDNMIIRKA
ncbi:MAG: DUF362 domain-containing protein, partial [bacterium]